VGLGARRQDQAPSALSRELFLSLMLELVAGINVLINPLSSLMPVKKLGSINVLISVFKCGRNTQYATRSHKVIRFKIHSFCSYVDSCGLYAGPCILYVGSCGQYADSYGQYADPYDL
jgi:hypothetical protein